MTDQTTKPRYAASNKTPIRRITAYEQEPNPIEEAHRTAMLLGGVLTGVKETLTAYRYELEKAKKEGYLLVVAQDALPEAEGWYRVNRKKASIDPITQAAADEFLSAGYWYEILHVDKSVACPVKSSRPLALGIECNENGRWYINAYFSDADSAWGALVKLDHKPPESPATRYFVRKRNRSLLRKQEE